MALVIFASRFNRKTGQVRALVLISPISAAVRAK
jgi:hypothetical protein